MPRLAFDAEQLHLTLDDGQTLAQHVLWLQDHDPARRHANGQRLDSVLDLDWDAAISEAALEEGDVLRVTLSNAREIRYGVDELAALSTGFPDERSRAHKTLWQGSEFSVARVEWADVIAGGEARRKALACVRDTGVVCLRGVPVEPGKVLEVIEQFGYVRETNYGKLFDVRTEVSPSNLAFSNLGLGAHTDNPYRDPAPSIQLLHCLGNEVEGGQTLLVDGFAAAERLRELAPESFALLTRTRVPFRFHDADHADLRSWVPFIETDHKGNIRQVRYNNRSIASLPLPLEAQRAFYRAYHDWARVIGQPEQATRLRLAPGDCLLFDNSRVMHARTAFVAGGNRHLQGAYADLDSLYSTLNLLENAR